MEPLDDPHMMYTQTKYSLNSSSQLGRTGDLLRFARSYLRLTSLSLHLHNHHLYIPSITLASFLPTTTLLALGAEQGLLARLTSSDVCHQCQL